mmetsp:Transcript_32216/g.81118  ORF Transcript_32216/g.81118 Transcript_32216/m.81118 type:complete len:273 (-) Transcript_32216:443-1261(-)
MRGEQGDGDGREGLRAHGGQGDREDGAHLQHDDPGVRQEGAPRGCDPRDGQDGGEWSPGGAGDVQQPPRRVHRLQQPRALDARAPQHAEAAPQGQPAAHAAAHPGAVPPAQHRRRLRGLRHGRQERRRRGPRRLQRPHRPLQGVPHARAGPQGLRLHAAEGAEARLPAVAHSHLAAQPGRRAQVGPHRPRPPARERTAVQDRDVHPARRLLLPRQPGRGGYAPHQGVPRVRPGGHGPDPALLQLLFEGLQAAQEPRAVCRDARHYGGKRGGP